MTIIVESSAVGGGIEYHQSPIHSESLSVVEMYFLIEMYRFHGSYRP